MLSKKDGLKNRFQSLVEEPLVRVLLHLDEVGHSQHLVDAGKAHTGSLTLLDRLHIYHPLNHSVPSLGPGGGGGAVGITYNVILYHNA